MPQANTIASRIIKFLSSLHGLDNFPVPTGNAAIDLRSGMIVRPSENYPDAQSLVLEYSPGTMPGCTEVCTAKLVNLYLLHHAEVEAIINGGQVKYYLEQINELFSLKTGYLTDASLKKQRADRDT